MNQRVGIAHLCRYFLFFMRKKNHATTSVVRILSTDVVTAMMRVASLVWSDNSIATGRVASSALGDRISISTA
jgi:hypothetical protein